MTALIQLGIILGVSAGISDPQVVRSVVTILVLLPCFYVILSKRYTPTEKHWAYGTVGTVLGFWLRGG